MMDLKLKLAKSDLFTFSKIDRAHTYPRFNLILKSSQTTLPQTGVDLDRWAYLYPFVHSLTKIVNSCSSNDQSVA